MKIAYITGATKGIGRATAVTFANAGWDLILLARDLEMLEMLRDELSDTGSTINLVKCNLSNANEIDNSINESIKKYGQGQEAQQEAAARRWSGAAAGP